jgi:hypothetical protein
LPAITIVSSSASIAGQWAGLEQEAKQLQQKIARLCGLVSTAVYDLN